MDIGVLEPVYIPPSFRGRKNARRSWRRSFFGGGGGRGEEGEVMQGGVERSGSLVGQRGSWRPGSWFGGGGGQVGGAVVGQRGSWRRSWYGWRDHGVGDSQGGENRNEMDFVGGFKLQQRLSRLDTREGKRLGVVEGDDECDRVGLWDGREEIEEGEGEGMGHERGEGEGEEQEVEDSGKERRQRRNTFEAWKMGLVPGSPVSWGRETTR